MSNHLSSATSSYLKQHADHPIDWWPWCEDALAEARRRDLPLLISLGYSACHWCHVMAAESFEDPEVAEIVNRYFIPIKIDREEHPDLDAIYMTATQALTGQGGWPNTVFATPDGDPFFAGTYFPPEPRDGLPSFRELCETIGTAWQERRDEMESTAAAVAESLQGVVAGGGETAKSNAIDVIKTIADSYDMINSGFGAAPKFPNPTLLDALTVKGETGSLEMAQLSAEAMARGGIFDQVGGGFHRYATDASWAIPHFEKMLYDNALLLGAYCRVWRRTPVHDPAKRDLFERVIYSTISWLLDEMGLSGGGFAASLDADSPDKAGVTFEGIYYLWSIDLLIDALGPEDGAWAAKQFHVTTEGTYGAGLSTLQILGSTDWGRVNRVLPILKEDRDQRARPCRDDKVVAAWNGWLIDSLVTAAMLFREQEWLDSALRCARYLWDTHVVGDELRRVSVDGVAHTVPGVTEDYAAVALGFARLAGACGDPIWLERAQWCLDQVIARFSADDGGFYDAAQQVFLRPRDLRDNPTPSATATMIQALRLVGLLSCRDDYLNRADSALETCDSVMAEYPRHAGWAVQEYLITDEARKGLKPAQVVVVDADGDPFSLLNCAVWRMAPAGSALVCARPGTSGFGHLFDQRETSSDGQAQAFICRGTVCFEPVTDYNELRDPLWTRC